MYSTTPVSQNNSVANSYRASFWIVKKMPEEIKDQNHVDFLTELSIRYLFFKKLEFLPFLIYKPNKKAAINFHKI